MQEANKESKKKISLIKYYFEKFKREAEDGSR